MCSIPKPKAPTMPEIPQRQPVLMPDGGDPLVRAGLRGQRRLTTSAMIFSKGGSLGSPSVSGPIGSSGL